MIKDDEIRKKVIEIGTEERRKKRMIVFGMKKDENETDKEKLERMIEDLNVDVKLERVIRMSSTEQNTGKGPRPMIIEFSSEHDKWEVLKVKKKLREIKEWERVFLELDLSREKREELRKGRRREEE